MSVVGIALGIALIIALGIYINGQIQTAAVRRFVFFAFACLAFAR